MSGVSPSTPAHAPATPPTTDPREVLVVTPDPTDPLGIDEVLAARRRWDAQLAEIRAGWDRLAPLPESTARIEQNQPADLPDDLDLTRFDHLAEQTDKLTVFDDLLLQPPQSPQWRPQETV